MHETTTIDLHDEAGAYASSPRKLHCAARRRARPASRISRTRPRCSITLPGSELGWASTCSSGTASWSSDRSRASPRACGSPLGKGVCGTAAATPRGRDRRDVHEFPGHIACDSASNFGDRRADGARRASCSACWTSTARSSRVSTRGSGGTRASSSRCCLKAMQVGLQPGVRISPCARDVLAGARIDADDFAFVDEQRHAHDRAGLELRGLLRHPSRCRRARRDRSRRP